MNADKELDKALKIIAKNAKHYRNLMGLTQEDMSTHGFDYRFYQRIESGSHSMSLHTVVRLACVFKVPLYEMLTPKKKY